MPTKRPSFLTKYGAVMWDSLVTRHPELGDEPETLAVGCETWARWREAVELRKKNGSMTTVTSKDGGYTQTFKAPWVDVETTAAKDFRAWATEFGLTPAARGAVVDEAEAKAQKIDDKEASGLADFTAALERRRRESGAAT